MTERFTAQGSPELWLASSIETLEQLGFKDIIFKPGEREVSGFKNGAFSIEVSPDSANKTQLILKSDSVDDIDEYKKVVTRNLAFFKKQPEENIYIKLSTPIGEIQEQVQPVLNPPALASDNQITLRREPVLKQEPIIEENHKQESVAKPIWYKSTWFIFLITVIVPPLGIFLMWRFNLFYEKDRKIFTTFFCIYMILWLWLLYTLLFYRTFERVVPPPVDDTASPIEQINAYWGTEQVNNYITQMPALITTYDDLSINGELGSESGDQTAQDVFNQVQALSEGVLSIGQVSDTSAAFTLQQKVNEAAQAFLNAVETGRNAIGSGDINAINESINAWTAAENTYYEINYIYQSAVQMANENTSTDNSGENLVVDESNENIDILE